jgi:hypothetical protein
MQWEPANDEFPGVEGIQPAEQMQKRTFSTATRPGDGDELARSDFE